MRILLITPFDPRVRNGNGVTVVRWARLLRELRHRVELSTEYVKQRADCCIALHAHRSAESIRRWRAERPDAPLVVGLSGTDLYVDLPGSLPARRSLELADRLVLLQPEGHKRLTPAQRRKAVTIWQSAEPIRPRPAALKRCFEVVVLSGLRAVKDPLRAALAARRLPDSSRICVTHVGPARDEQLVRCARTETERNRRYRWRGSVTHRAAQRLLARSRATVISSLSEGGANAVAEAVVNRVPILASRIEGTIGQLGRGYPGFFPVGDTAALARLLHRVETEGAFRRDLLAAMRAVAPRFRRSTERGAWRDLLRSF